MELQTPVLLKAGMHANLYSSRINSGKGLGKGSSGVEV
jgi:hypothetical protein